MNISNQMCTYWNQENRHLPFYNSFLISEKEPSPSSSNKPKRKKKPWTEEERKSFNDGCVGEIHRYEANASKSGTG
jgi:hypothetical protein